MEIRVRFSDSVLDICLTSSVACESDTRQRFDFRVICENGDGLHLSEDVSGSSCLGVFHSIYHSLIVAPHPGLWCNGSTTLFGGVGISSNLVRPTIVNSCNPYSIRLIMPLCL